MIAAAYLSYFRYDCGERTDKTIRTGPREYALGPQPVSQRTIREPRRNWKGECLVTVTIERTTVENGVETVRRSSRVLRTNPGPIELIEER